MAFQGGVREFRDDDAGYLNWLELHQHGYVINILGSYNTAGAKVHRADCRTINGENPLKGMWTRPYVKVCAMDRAELDLWATERFDMQLDGCGTCHPEGRAVEPRSTRQTVQAPAAAVDKAHFVIDGPGVRAWATDYIPFGNLPDWQKQLRNEIRSRCRVLEPSPEQVLHAEFFGDKHPKADVENLVTYNIDTFKTAGRNGIRFEHGGDVPPAPDGGGYRYCYSYGLAPRSDSFAHWRLGRRLASFGWVDLGSFRSEKQLAQVWLALWRGKTETFFPAIEADTAFSVQVQVRAPHRHQPVWGGLLKGVMDGVICAHEAHTDTSVLPGVVARLATMLPAEPDEIEQYLRDKRRGVLGEVNRLVSPYQAGVKWDPSDHLCVAGELLGADPGSADDRWAIKGEIFEVSRQPG